LQEELSLLDAVSLGDGKVGDLAHHERGQIHLAASLNLAVGRHLGQQIDLFDLRGCDMRQVAILSRDGKGQDGAESHNNGDNQDDLQFLRHQRRPPPSGRNVMILTTENSESSRQESRDRRYLPWSPQLPLTTWLADDFLMHSPKRPKRSRSPRGSHNAAEVGAPRGS